jgi:acetyl-CoA carboxylase biotin carboxyl carrier protein
LTLTAKEVAEIMRILEESSFDSLSLEMDGVKLHLERGSPAPPPATPGSAPTPATASLSTPAQRPQGATPAASDLVEIPSPLLGIFHRAPKPGAPPFVQVGSNVEEPTVIGIIEVMKLMNSVHAGVKGAVVEIVAEDGTAVEYGQILMRVRPEAS